MLDTFVNKRYRAAILPASISGGIGIKPVL